MSAWRIMFLIATSCLTWAPLHAERIRLSTGEVLTVEVLSINDQEVRFRHPLLGEQSLPRSEVTVLPAEDSASKDPAPTAAAPAAPSSAPPGDQPSSPSPPPPPPPPPPADPDDWKFKLVLGAGLTSGNTENGNFTTTFTAIRETPRVKTALDTGYFFAQTNGDRNQNRFTIGGRHDWLNPGSKWFQFADARYDVDEFQSWDSRINGHVGVGYRLIEPPKLAVNLLAGIGAVKEFGSLNEDVRPEGLLGVEGQYDFAPKHSIKFSSIYYPDLSELDEYRWVNNLGWSFLIDNDEKLSLIAGLQHEYQSKVDPGRKHDDLRLFAGLEMEF